LPPLTAPKPPFLPSLQSLIRFYRILIGWSRVRKADDIRLVTTANCAEAAVPSQPPVVDKVLPHLNRLVTGT
ncbi:hypothetical protein VS884_26290, partial [Escherichia coli]